MDDLLKISGGAALLALALSWLFMFITLMTSHTINEGAWSCTDFNVKKQHCIKYEDVGKL